MTSLDTRKTEILAQIEKLKIIDVASMDGEVTLEDYEAVIKATNRIEAKYAKKDQ